MNKIYGSDSMMRLMNEIALNSWDELYSADDEKFSFMSNRLILQSRFDNFALICGKDVISV